MSLIRLSSVLAPPFFPYKNRLPDSIEQVQANADLQIQEEKAYKLALNAQNDLNNSPPCCKSLHISLFFDGTNNNEKANTAAKHPNPSNIARLYHAALENNDGGYYSYYIPGVGTAFPEIGELDFSDDGLRFATGGEQRINWALTRILDAIGYTLTKKNLEDTEAKQIVDALTSSWVESSNLAGMKEKVGRRRQSIFTQLLEPLRAKAIIHQPKILKIKLFIYGFSRGAAEARAFVNWLTDILDGVLLQYDPSGPYRKTAQSSQNKAARPALLGWPLTIEFLGLCDTVASVGIARVTPGLRGHMGWADDNLALPDEDIFPGLIQRCCHFVSAHEQRLCFPLDSVRRTDGNYPVNTVEVVYPGVHSDVGGGYVPGEQGKGVENALILSQIVLHDLYAAAFAVGAPFSVPESVIPPDLLSRKPTRRMEDAVLEEFKIKQPLIDRFNAWRNTLQNGLSQTLTPGYEPVSLTHSLESVIEQQMAWMTAWRIGRFVNDSYRQEPFYTSAKWNSEDSDPDVYRNNKAARDAKQQEREKSREEIPNTPGVPIFEPARDQQQLQEAANEFRADYQTLVPYMVGMDRQNTGDYQLVLDDILGKVIYILDPDDQAVEYIQMKSSGNSLVSKLFKDGYGTVTDDSYYAQICALYDDHIHDSRAWFMHSSLGARELWGGYFRYRTIFSGDNSNKGTSLLTKFRKAGDTYIGLHIYSAQKLYRISKEVGSVLKQGRELSAQAQQLEVEAIAARNEEIRRIIKQGGGLSAQAKQLEIEITMARNGKIRQIIQQGRELSAQAQQLEIDIITERNEKIRQMGKTIIRGVVDKITPQPLIQDCQVSDSSGNTVCQVPVYINMFSPVSDITELRKIYNQQQKEKYQQQLDDLTKELNSSASTEE